jgi:hypothetical protein
MTRAAFLEVTMFSVLLRFLCVGAIGTATLTAAAASERADNGAAACIQIRTAAQLQAMQNNLAGVYCLANDIDASSVPNFVPIGNLSAFFTGRLYGNGHVIRNLTINSAVRYVGLIGVMTDGLIQDLGLVNAKVTSSAGAFVGALVGVAEQFSGPVSIARVYSTGQVKCTSPNCEAGGLIGAISLNTTLTDSWSSADIIGSFFAGGLAGTVEGTGAKVIRAYATGSVTCTLPSCLLTGGLAASVASNGQVQNSFASGPVTGGDNNLLGGLVGQVNGGTILRSHATGPVRGGDGANAGSLVGFDFGGPVFESYGAGNVTAGTGAVVGGLIGAVGGSPAVLDSYWDTVTTFRTTSAGGGKGLTTAQLRGALPTGFTSSWSITKTLSYPFLNSAGFTPPLATLVMSVNQVLTVLPIGQLDNSQYRTAPSHATGAALATVYTMLARAIGITLSVPQLTNVKIDRFFWHDAAQATTFLGPVKQFASLAPLRNIGAATALSAANVIGQMDMQRLVILRGTFVSGNGKTFEHWMLGTLYTKSGANVNTIVANDPWTGMQVEISPVTKKVVTPANFPLKNFTVNGYQPVVVQIVVN